MNADDGRIVNHTANGKWWDRQLAREARDRQLAEQAAQRSRFEVRRILTGTPAHELDQQEG